MRTERFRVTIQCNRCGEHFFLKGREKNGRLETGFRRCLCDNDNDFTIKTEKPY